MMEPNNPHDPLLDVGEQKLSSVVPKLDISGIT